MTVRSRRGVSLVATVQMAAMFIAAIVTAGTAAFRATARVQQPAPTGIQIRAVRFWLGKNTSVMASVDVPYALATPVGAGSDAYIAYQVRVTVLDSLSRILDDEKWERHQPAALRGENASGIEQLAFGIVPGNYWLRVEVKDSATQKVVADSIKVDGFTVSPGVSDLLLASRIRAVPAGDTSTDIGEMARGDFRFITAPNLHIDLTQPTMGFLLEAYSQQQATATLALKVATSDGTDLVPLLPKTQTIPAGGGIIASQFSLEGLPAGRYILKASLTMNGSTTERQAPFVVNAEQVALATSMRQAAANKGLDAVYFNSLPEDSLDAYADELELVPGVTARERAPYRKDELSLSAKRAFLIEFWAKRDEVKSTPENETRMAFYERVGYVNAHFSQRFVAGWKTAMGRIYIKYGPPDDSLSNHMGGRGIPYTIWRMSRGKPRWFIFGDRSNTGAFVLLRTNETLETGTPGWVTMLTPEVVRQDICPWLNLSPDYFNSES